MSARAEKRSEPRPARESRHRAREAALQMLYTWEVGRLSLQDVRQTFWSHDEETDEPLDGPDKARPTMDAGLREFAEALADGVAGAVGDLDPLIAAATEHWRIERMNVLDRLILRLAVYEFLYRPDTHAKVIINEALELARSFSGDESVRFINGILDNIRRTLERE